MPNLESVDPFRWLEDPDSPDTIAWVAEQNRRSEAFLSSIPARDVIRARLTALWNYERCGPPERYGDWYIFSKNDGLQPQAVLYKTRTLDGPAEVLLDPNLLSPDGTIALAATSVSDDGRWLAYALSASGSDWMTWRIRDIATGVDLADEVPWSKFSTASWAHDGSGFYYAGYEPPADGNLFTTVNTGHTLYFHRIGVLGARSPGVESDRVVFAAPAHPDWLFAADVTDDGRWLVITQSQGTNRESRILLQDLSGSVAQATDAPVVPFLDRFDASYQVVANDADVFYVLTDHNAPRGRLVAIRTGHVDPSAWTTVIAEAPGTDVLASVIRVGDAWVAVWRTDAHERIVVHALDGAPQREVPLPVKGAIVSMTGRRHQPDVFFSFSSFTYPGTVFRHIVSTGETSVWHEPKVDFDPSAFETTQVFYPSKDGTRIPMFIVHKRGLVLDGSHRTYLYGYGGFDISLTPAFSASIVAWMERGGVFAQANLRGGGEYGKAWHDAGRLKNKQNVFDDFIAAAEYLISNGYTTSARLAIGGGSNGGLLVGACMTQRPDLFGAAVPAVGVLDMLRFHKFTIGWAWTSDYGNPDEPEDRAVLLKYSPLHNIKPGTHYPATLVITADHDDRVAPAHSHKFTATLQAAQAGPAPILTRIDVKAGHGAGKPTAKVIAEKADVWAFLEAVLGSGSRVQGS
ncbi:MAG TPA: prolyl oligopeptidase family serine peptidase [Vicinamibacterales bacterium]|nr:S9 family peptidase [Acidobacteriota bacterium]HQX80491.1 prolyl oligopeptidase family serine peptidase [Vicinamibacterales bacterium]